MWLQIKEPPDGFTQHEVVFMRDLVVQMYSVLGDTTDRFIVAMCVENGYNQEEVGQMLNISQAAVSKRLSSAIGKIRKKHADGRL